MKTTCTKVEKWEKYRTCLIQCNDDYSKIRISIIRNKILRNGIIIHIQPFGDDTWIRWLNGIIVSQIFQDTLFTKLHIYTLDYVLN